MEWNGDRLTWEWVSVDQRVWQSQFHSKSSDFIFVEFTEGLNNPPLQRDGGGVQNLQIIHQTI